MKLIKQTLGLALAAILLVGGVAACAGDNGGDEATTTTLAAVDQTSTTVNETETLDDTDPNTGGGLPTGTISVYSRDESSGTREAFSSVIGIDEDAGELVETAAITSGNGDQATKVGSDAQAIGYVALTTDFEASGIRPVPYEGVEPSEENVLSGAYALYRPFSYVTRAEGDYASDEEEQLTAAFIAFLTDSIEGREAVAVEGGIVDVAGGTPWAELAEDHPIVNEDNSGVTLITAGSTSVENALESAQNAFVPLAGNVNFSRNHTGSSDGFKRVMGGEKDGASAAHIGFASREFNDSETEVVNAMASGEFCKDAVVLVVAESNALDNITQEQVYDIYTGEYTEWEDIID